MCDPILVMLLKMRPHYSQSSRKNETPSSGTSPLAFYKEVHPPPPTLGFGSSLITRKSRSVMVWNISFWWLTVCQYWRSKIRLSTYQARGTARRCLRSRTVFVICEWHSIKSKKFNCGHLRWRHYNNRKCAFLGSMLDDPTFKFRSWWLCYWTSLFS